MQTWRQLTETLTDREDFCLFVLGPIGVDADFCDVEDYLERTQITVTNVNLEQTVRAFRAHYRLHRRR